MRRQEASSNFKEELQTQILMNAEVRKKDRMEFLNEGAHQRSEREVTPYNLTAYAPTHHLLLPA